MTEQMIQRIDYTRVFGALLAVAGLALGVEAGQLLPVLSVLGLMALGFGLMLMLGVAVYFILRGMASTLTVALALAACLFVSSVWLSWLAAHFFCS